jgi:hypothetical protein
MSSAFLFLCLAAADRGRAALAGAAALAAAMSKEVGFLAPVYVALWGLAWGRPGARGVAGAATGVAVALALRLAADLGLTPPSELDPLTLASAPGKVIASTFGWLVWPWPLTSSMSLRAAPPSLLRWASACVAIAGLFLAWRAAPRRNGALYACALLAWAPTLLAVVLSFYVSERFLYLPLAFLAVAVASTVPASRPVVAAGVAAGVTALAVLTVRVPEWRSEIDIWKAAVARVPDATSNAQLGQAYEQAGMGREAFQAWLASAAYEPRIPMACQAPVRLLLSTGAAEQAATLSDELLARGCSEADFAGWRAAVLLLAGRAEEARAALAASPERLADAPLRAALCDLDGDESCVAANAVAWSDGPSAFREAVFDLVTARPATPAE